ncbi:MAG: DUF2291 domain-containing protein [Bacteroidales bacterium]
MKKSIKIILGIAAVLLLLFLSLDIRKLDVYKEGQPSSSFDATAYAREVWDRDIPEIARQAPDIETIIRKLESDPESAFSEMGRQLGISKTWYFMGRGAGVIDSVGEENLFVTLGSGDRVTVATGFIFGNTVRDGSGAVDIDDFVNMTDFNNVSVALNKLVKEEVVPYLLRWAGPGKEVAFAGAFEVSEEEIDVTSIRIIPVTAEMINGER